MAFFVELEQIILKCLWKHKSFQITKKKKKKKLDKEKKKKKQAIGIIFLISNSITKLQ